MAAYAQSSKCLGDSAVDRIPDRDEAREHKDYADGNDDVYERPGVTVGDHLCHAPGIVAGRDRVQDVAHRSAQRTEDGRHRADLE
jgi:hypothetical protein